MNGGTRSARFESRRRRRQERPAVGRRAFVRNRGSWAQKTRVAGYTYKPFPSEHTRARSERSRAPASILSSTRAPRGRPHRRVRLRRRGAAIGGLATATASPRAPTDAVARLLGLIFESFVNGSKRASRSRSARHDGGQPVRGEGRGEPVRRARRAAARAGATTSATPSSSPPRLRPRGACPAGGSAYEPSLRSPRRSARAIPARTGFERRVRRARRPPCLGVQRVFAPPCFSGGERPRVTL